ncbi:hypothetical protein J2X66_004240 [Pseudomonas sp. 3296]|uniref:hypothetical protein n=1 Tax=Pseudomonas sp. 3296 TaxID=2817753 RepID=UPI002860644A|nr:hypothetical protein [Pseudomonas sp. 3296]MDR6917361.1 hypothetical protein [Pseudomonas sp. 3296]
MPSKWNSPFFTLMVIDPSERSASKSIEPAVDICGAGSDSGACCTTGWIFHLGIPSLSVHLVLNDDVER